MKRYETRIEQGVLYLDRGDRRVEIGEMSVIMGELGEVYEIEYPEGQSARVPWLDLEDDVLTVDVNDKLRELTFDEEFVDHVAEAALDEPAEESDMPARTDAFIDLLQRIWDSKGDPGEY